MPRSSLRPLWALFPPVEAGGRGVRHCPQALGPGMTGQQLWATSSEARAAPPRTPCRVGGRGVSSKRPQGSDDRGEAGSAIPSPCPVPSGCWQGLVPPCLWHTHRGPPTPWGMLSSDAPPCRAPGRAPACHRAAPPLLAPQPQSWGPLAPTDRPVCRAEPSAFALCAQCTQGGAGSQPERCPGRPRPRRPRPRRLVPPPGKPEALPQAAGSFAHSASCTAHAGDVAWTASDPSGFQARGVSLGALQPPRLLPTRPP